MADQSTLHGVKLLRVTTSIYMCAFISPPENSDLKLLTCVDLESWPQEDHPVGRICVESLKNMQPISADPVTQWCWEMDTYLGAWPIYDHWSPPHNACDFTPTEAIDSTTLSGSAIILWMKTCASRTNSKISNTGVSAWIALPSNCTVGTNDMFSSVDCIPTLHGLLGVLLTPENHANRLREGKWSADTDTAFCRCRETKNSSTFSQTFLKSRNSIIKVKFSKNYKWLLIAALIYWAVHPLFMEHN